MRPRIVMSLGLQSVAPFKEPSSRIDHYTKSGAVTLLGFYQL
jgi:hypothetical protein